MNTHTYTAGTLVIAFLIGGLPLAVFADTDRGERDDDIQGIVTASARVSDDDDTDDIEASTTVRVRSDDDTATSSNRSRPQVRDDDDGDEDLDEIEIDDDDVLPARSFDDLKRRIEVRRQQLERAAASTTPAGRDIVGNTNPVRLAVHSLLVSKDLLGGIGPRVSEIAKQMNNAAASTTSAEAKIQSRGFLTRLFFGGDRTAADVIAEAVAQNQQRIDGLTKLLGESNVSVEIQTTLKVQIVALQEAQTRLQDLAEKEQKMWGLFSWRF